MTFRKVLVQQANCWDTEKEDHFFVIKLEFDTHHHIFVVWKDHNIDIYEQLLFACKNLQPEEPQTRRCRRSCGLPDRKG